MLTEVFYFQDVETTNEFFSSYLHFPEFYKVSTMCIIHIITHTK